MSKTADEVREVIYDAVSKTMGIDRATLTDEVRPIDDLGAESVNIVHIISALEDEFEYQVDFMPFRRQRSIAEMIDFMVDIIDN